MKVKTLRKKEDQKKRGGLILERRVNKVER